MVTQYMDSPGKPATTPNTEFSDERAKNALWLALALAFPVGVAVSFSVILASLVFENAGESAFVNGLAIGAPLAGVLCGIPLLPQLRKYLTAARLVYIGFLLIAGCGCVMALWFDPWAWILLRFIVGLGASPCWVFSEAWVVYCAPAARRGFWLGMYSAIMALGYISGPILIGLLGSDPQNAILLAALSLFGAFLTFIVHRKIAEPPMEGSLFSLSLVAAMPMLAVAAFVSGVVEEATLGLVPVWVLRNGWDETIAVSALFAFSLGSALWQLPLGRIADRYGARPFLFAVAASCIAVPLLLLFQDDPNSLGFLFLFFVWGGAGFAIYTLSLAVLGNDIPHDHLARANGLYIMCFASGVILGPPITGFFMEQFGADALLVSMAVVPLLLFASLRFIRRPL